MSRTADYRAFCRDVIDRRFGGRCFACGRGEADGVRLFVHHTIPVAALGGSHPGVMSERVVVAVCSFHHELSHGGRRSFPWSAISRARGRLLRGAT